MFEPKYSTTRIALTSTGTATLRHPDRLDLVFTGPLLRSIAKALAILDTFDETDAQLTLPLGDIDTFFCNGRPWPLKDGSDGNFVVSSSWIHVEANQLHIEVWESYSNDELHGFVEFAEMPTLREAAERYRRESEDGIIQRLRVRSPD